MSFLPPFFYLFQFYFLFSFQFSSIIYCFLFSQIWLPVFFTFFTFDLCFIPFLHTLLSFPFILLFLSFLHCFLSLPSSFSSLLLSIFLLLLPPHLHFLLVVLSVFPSLLLPFFISFWLSFVSVLNPFSHVSLHTTRNKRVSYSSFSLTSMSMFLDAPSRFSSDDGEPINPQNPAASKHT